MSRLRKIKTRVRARRASREVLHRAIDGVVVRDRNTTPKRARV